MKPKYFLTTLMLMSSLVTVHSVTSPQYDVTKRLTSSSVTSSHDHLLMTSDDSLAGATALLGAFNRALGRVDEHFVQQAQTLLMESSDNCSHSLQLLLTALSGGERWAQKMVDAWGKPGSGLLQGQFRWLGSFQECLNVSNNQTSPSLQVLGQYCLASVSLNVSSLPIPVQVGTCFPSSCNSSDVQRFITTVLQETVNLTLPDLTVKCQARHLDLSNGAVATIFILSLLGLLLVLGTAYDVIAAQRSKWRKEEETEKSTMADSMTFPAGVEVDPSYRQGQRGQTQVETASTSVLLRLLVSFSVYTNGQKLLDTNQPPGSLTAVHGIRFLSMTWVLLGHSLASGLELYANQLEFQQEVSSRWTFLAITNSTVSVDTFFLLSGLLVSYLLVKDLNKFGSPRKFNWGLFYFHRYWRLTPAYMLVLVTFTELGRYVGSGPLWPQEGLDVTCYSNWWTNLLYVNNLVHRDKECMPWSWYLAMDMQFYVVSPLIVVPLVLFPVAGLAVACIFLLVTTSAASVLSSVHSMPAAMGVGPQGAAEANELGPYMLEYYLMPYCRMGPYVIGLLTGYVLQRNKCQLAISKSVNLLCWCCATAMCLAVIYGLWPVAKGNQMSVAEAAAYNALHRTAWGLGVAWVVFACATGYGGFVNTLLSWKGFVPLSRLTYCCYLLHLWIMTIFYYSEKALINISDINLVFNFFGNLMATYGLAVVTSLAVEAPMLAIERVLFNRR